MSAGALPAHPPGQLRQLQQWPEGSADQARQQTETASDSRGDCRQNAVAEKPEQVEKTEQQEDRQDSEDAEDQTACHASIIPAAGIGGQGLRARPRRRPSRASRTPARQQQATDGGIQSSHAGAALLVNPRGRGCARAAGCHAPQPGSDPLPAPGAPFPMQMQVQHVAFEQRPARNHLAGEPPLVHLQHHRRTGADRMRRRGTHAAARHGLDHAWHGGLSGPKHLQSALDAMGRARVLPLVHQFLTSPRR